MGSTSTELTGPDLVAGVDLGDLAEERPLLGHAHGEPVILVRQGERVFATGATCSHYSGPLAEGLVVGSTVRCPWHHACFSLETGEAVGAPALSPIPCYEVARRGSRVSVGARQAPPERALDEPGLPRAVVVIGAGAAGAAAVEELRRDGYRGTITLVGDEPPGPVDRPNLSKDYLAGNAPEEWIPLRSDDFYRELSVDFLLGDPAVEIDTAAKRVRLQSGRALEFDALLLATGARPRKLDVPGGALPHVHLLRTLADSRAIVTAAEGTKRAVVIGSSFIGLEAAASLRHRELEVDVVGVDAVPLERVLGAEIGAFVRRLHEEKGVRFHLGRSVREITPARVELDDGTRLDAELVVAGVGVVPRTELAEQAKLRVENGIVVDALLRASAPGIYAAGDAARYPDPITGQPARIEHWVAAERQGQAAARSLLGKGKPFSDAPFFWSQHYDVTLAYVGHAAGWDRIETRGSLDARDYAAAYVKNDRIQAVLCIGRDMLSLRAERCFELGDADALARLFAEA